MDIFMTPKTSSALAEYLDREYRKRSAQDRNFSLRQWASEIDIDESLLNRMINGRNSGPKQISIEVLNKLLVYFGPEMLAVLGIALPEKPRNPMYSPPMATGLSVAEKSDRSYGAKKEGK
jgi:plasmid maintenance system antidote protein VapI